VHDGDVDAIDVVRGEEHLQPIADPTVLGEDDDARRVAVQAMDVWTLPPT
jgi:hypothetical protein